MTLWQEGPRQGLSPVLHEHPQHGEACKWGMLASLQI